MERRRYRLRKKEGNHFSRSGKTIRLNIPVTSDKLEFEEPPINISTPQMNAVLVKLVGNENPTPTEPVSKEIKIKIKSGDIDIEPANLKRDGFLAVAIYNDSKPLDSETINNFRQLIVDSGADYYEAIKRLRLDYRFDMAKPKENDGDVIGGNG